MTRRRKVYLIIGLFAVVSIFLVGLGFLVPFGVLFTLLFGWIRFIRDVVSTATVEWTELFFFILMLFAFVAVLHSFCRWLYGHICEASTKWKFSWSASITALIFLLFLTTMSTVGIAHQVAWMPQQSLTKNSWEGMRLRRACEKLVSELEQPTEKSEVLQQLQMQVTHRSRQLFSDYSISVIPSKSGKADGLLVTYKLSEKKLPQSPVVYCRFDQDWSAQTLQFRQIPQLLDFINQENYEALRTLSP